MDDDDSDNINEEQFKKFLANSLLKEMGFEIASEATFGSSLQKINPKGQAAFRDAFIKGCALMLQLADLLAKLGFLERWNLVHIIVTDGEDEKSESTIGTLLKTVQAMNQKINVNLFKVVIIGVGVSAQRDKELKTIVEMGEKIVEYYKADSTNIKKIFERVSVSLGLQKKRQITVLSSQAFAVQEKLEPALQLQIHSYAVLLNLQVSLSMTDIKWNETCGMVSKLLESLGDSDIASVMLFNETARLLSGMQQSDPLFQSTPQPPVIIVIPNKPSGKFQTEPSPVEDELRHTKQQQLKQKEQQLKRLKISLSKSQNQQDVDKYPNYNSKSSAPNIPKPPPVKANKLNSESNKNSQQEKEPTQNQQKLKEQILKLEQDKQKLNEEIRRLNKNNNHSPIDVPPNQKKCDCQFCDQLQKKCQIY